MIALQNFVVPFQATTGAAAALQSQLGTELKPPGTDLAIEQWPAFALAVVVLFALVRRPALRSRATLTAGAFAVAFLLAALQIRRFFELGAPLALLALALVVRERERRRVVELVPPRRPRHRRLGATPGPGLDAGARQPLRQRQVVAAARDGAVAGRARPAGRAGVHGGVGRLLAAVLLGAPAAIAGGGGLDVLLRQGPGAVRHLHAHRRGPGPGPGARHPRAVRRPLGERVEGLPDFRQSAAAQRRRHRPHRPRLRGLRPRSAAATAAGGRTAHRSGDGRGRGARAEVAAAAARRRSRGGGGGLRLAALRGAAPWSYDEYYHLGLAREMRSHLRLDLVLVDALLHPLRPLRRQHAALPRCC